MQSQPDEVGGDNDPLSTDQSAATRGKRIILADSRKLEK